MPEKSKLYMKKRPLGLARMDANKELIDAEIINAQEERNDG
jgi:hypothetical protein